MRTRTWLGILVVLALALRVAMLSLEPTPYLQSGLVALHGEVAHNIVEHGRWFVQTDVGLNAAGAEIARTHGIADPADIDYPADGGTADGKPLIIEPPGLALTLAGLWTVTGDQSFIYAQALEVLWDTAMVLLVFWIVLKLFGRPRAALLAAAAYAVWVPVAGLVSYPDLNFWAVGFSIPIFALALRAHERPDVRRLVALGAVTGVGMYFRPGLVLIVLGFAVVVGIQRRWREALRFAAVPAAVALLLVTPWLVRNVVEFDRFVPMRTGLGQSLWEGLGERPNDFGAVLNDIGVRQMVARERPQLEPDTPEYDAYLREKALDAVADHPGHYVRVVGRRVVHSTVLLRNYDWRGEPESPGAFRSRTGKSAVAYPFEEPGDALRYAVWYLLEPLAFIASALVVVLTWRRFRPRHALLIAYLLATVLPYWLLHFEERYVLPITLAYVALIGLGADLLLERLRARRAVAPSPA